MDKTKKKKGQQDRKWNVSDTEDSKPYDIANNYFPFSIGLLIIITTFLKHGQEWKDGKMKVHRMNLEFF